MAESLENVVKNPDSFLDNNLNKDDVMNEYFTGRKNKQLCDSLKNGYKEMAAINLELADSCLEADNQCLLDYEEKLSECE